MIYDTQLDTDAYYLAPIFAGANVSSIMAFPSHPDSQASSFAPRGNDTANTFFCEPNDGDINTTSSELPFCSANSPGQLFASPAEAASKSGELSLLLFKLNAYMPEKLVTAAGQNSFENISPLASSLCELIRSFERCTMQAEDKGADCLLLAISVVGSVVNIYYKMIEGLECCMLKDIELHKALRLLANTNTMEMQLVYMRRLCHKYSQVFQTFQSISRIDSTLGIIQRFAQLCKAGL